MKTLRKPLLLAFILTTPLSLQAQTVLETLKNQRTSWDYLLYTPRGGVPVDPGTSDPDFHTTWHTASAYNGPGFKTGNGYFGYGTVGSTPITTNIWSTTGAPPSGSRYTTYFRTTFTPTQAVGSLRLTGIIDDGAIIYLNGVELTRLNMPATADTWTLLSLAQVSETVAFTTTESVSLPAGVPVEIAASVHNQSSGSSDMGFDLLIESTLPGAAPNDNWVNATSLSGNFPIVAFGDTRNGIGGSRATKESGETNHAGDAGGSSVWWTWTPSSSGRVSVSTNGSSYNTLLAVYTGPTLTTLSSVSRYANLTIPASSSDEPFHPKSYVEFDAVAGTIYDIAIDGVGGDFGTITLTIDANFSELDPIKELLPARSDWSYLLLSELQGQTNQPIDPESLDADFDTTWHTATSYDGPAFSGPAPALLGYGVINADPVATDIWGGLDATGNGLGDDAPPTGSRHTNYFRTTFTPTNSVQHLGFEGLIDDGAIIYVNGVETTRINVANAVDANDWQATALGHDFDTELTNNVDTEDKPQVGFALDVNLPAGVPVEIAVSLHNADATSSDKAFDLRIYSTNLPLILPEPFVIELTVIARPLFPGSYVLTWTTIPGEFYIVEFSEDLESWISISSPLTGNGNGINNFVDSPPGSPVAAFYRIREN